MLGQVFHASSTQDRSMAGGKLLKNWLHLNRTSFAGRSRDRGDQDAFNNVEIIQLRNSISVREVGAPRTVYQRPEKCIISAKQYGRSVSAPESTSHTQNKHSYHSRQRQCRSWTQSDV